MLVADRVSFATYLCAQSSDRLGQFVDIRMSSPTVMVKAGLPVVGRPVELTTWPMKECVTAAATQTSTLCQKLLSDKHTVESNQQRVSLPGFSLPRAGAMAGHTVNETSCLEAKPKMQLGSHILDVFPPRAVE